MPTFPHQKAKKSFYQQHALSYNPTSPQPITLHGEHVSNHEADENPTHTERQAKKKKPAAASSINKKNRHSQSSVGFFGGARGIRTPDLFHAMEARYQLRHSPFI